jgi:hypothetical protein
LSFIESLPQDFAVNGASNFGTAERIRPLRVGQASLM